MMSGPPRRAAGDSGATAVEFALVFPLLMVLLFGIIQYGYGMYQMQAFSSSLGEATQEAATGIADCAAFGGAVRNLVEGNGLDPTKVTGVTVRWLGDDFAEVDEPSTAGMVRVSATFEPVKLGVPFVPFPDTISRTQTAAVQSVGLPANGIALPGCTLP